MSEVITAIEKVSAKVEEYKSELGKKADKALIEDVQKQIEKLAKTEDVEKFNATVAKLVTQMEEMGEDIQVFKQNRAAAGRVAKGLADQIIAKLKEEKVTQDSFTKGSKLSFNIDWTPKVAATMTTANVDAVGTNSIPFSLADYEMGLTRPQRRQPFLLQIANVSTTTKMYVQWAELENPDGAATSVAEGTAKPMIDFDWVEKSAKVEKIAAYIKVSKEMLDDIDGMRSEIETELREQVLLKLDADLLSGDGTTPDLNGLLNQGTAFAAGSFANSMTNVTKTDILRIAISQVAANLFVPDYALVHPTDLASMDLEKGEDGHYALAPFKSADGLTISGVRIIANTGQTIDKFTVGDFSKFNVKIREGFNVQVGYENDDFTKNLVTILGELRAVAYVKSHHTGAFVSGDFSDAIAAVSSSI